MDAPELKPIPLFTFAFIPEDENDSRNLAEIINLHHVYSIQLLPKDELLINFSNGTTRLLSGTRAKALLKQLVQQKNYD